MWYKKEIVLFRERNQHKCYSWSSIIYYFVAMPLRELNHITVVRNSLIYSFSAVWYAIFSVPMELLPQMCRNFAKTVESFVNVVCIVDKTWCRSSILCLERVDIINKNIKTERNILCSKILVRTSDIVLQASSWCILKAKKPLPAFCHDNLSVETEQFALCVRTVSQESNYILMFHSH